MKIAVAKCPTFHGKFKVFIVLKWPQMAYFSPICLKFGMQVCLDSNDGQNKNRGDIFKIVVVVANNGPKMDPELKFWPK